MAELIVYGADQDNGNLAGLSVADVRRMYENQFNIPSDAVAFVNGKSVSDEQGYVVKEGDKVRFDKPQERGR